MHCMLLADGLVVTAPQLMPPQNRFTHYNPLFIPLYLEVLITYH